MARSTTTRNLVLRGRVYHVTKEVPPSLRAVAGCKRLQNTLGTADLGVANRRKHGFLADYERMLHAWRRQVQGIAADPLLERARAAGEYARVNPHDETNEFGAELLAEEVLRRGRVYASSNLNEEEFAPGTDARAYEVERVARGEPLLSGLLTEFLADKAIGPKTQDRYKRGVERFLKWSHAKFADSVTVLRAHDYVTHLKTVYTKRATIGAEVTALGSFWRWLKKRGITELNPWADQRPERGTHAGEVEPWVAFTNKELGRVLGAMPEGEALGDALRIAALTGMRRDEVVSLCVVEDKEGLLCLTIPRGKGKTANAARTIPVPSALFTIVKRRRKLAGGLFSDLTAERRGDALGKHFSRVVRKDVGIIDPLKVFHSLRKWHTTELERAGVEPWTIEWVQGRSRQGLGMNVYSAGPALRQLRKVMDKVRLPVPVKAT